jgi:hypothetical protein
MITVSPDIELGSPMEALFYGLCCFHEIPVERIMLTAVTESGGTPWYWPGFRVAVPEVLDLHVEVSDAQNETWMRPCRAAFRQAGQHLVVLYREELDTLREAARPSQFAARLKMIDSQRLMAEYAFTVYVEVDEHGTDGGDRSPQD